MKKLGLILLLNISFVFSYGQITDPDESFKEARELAFNEKRPESIILLNKILEKSPNYHEIRLFLSSLHTWNSDYAKAEKELLLILEKDEKYKAVWVALIKNSLYADNSIKAMTYCFQGLNVFKFDPELIILKSKVLNYQRKPFDALEEIKLGLKQNKGDSLLTNYLNEIRKEMALNTIAVSAAVDYFTEIYDPMQYYTLQYSRETPKGSIDARININNKFGKTGVQYEVNAYPGLGKGRYAFLNLGYSRSSSIFPNWRYGAQIYQSLPKAYEASVGIRILDFGNGFVNIYTGSLGKYFGNSFIFFTPYIIPGGAGTSKSGSITYRKYGDNQDQFFGVRVGAGFSPELNRFGNVIEQNIVNLKAQSIGFTKNFSVKNNNNLISTFLSGTRQESYFDPGKYYFIISLSLGYDFSF